MHVVQGLSNTFPIRNLRRLCRTLHFELMTYFAETQATVVKIMKTMTFSIFILLPAVVGVFVGWPVGSVKKK